ncbi:hypothetical protein [Streptomyces sp. NPDC058579]|uniref:hypothetical protein n=1 Tax=Streptomyces sp. NPDC058579 TaxID=3346548 RepID=UPI00365E36BE
MNEEPSRSRFDLSPRQPTAPVLGTSYVTAEKACPCCEPCGNEGQQCRRNTGLWRRQPRSARQPGKHRSGESERDIHEGPETDAKVGSAFQSLRFSQHTLDFSSEARPLPLRTARMLPVVISHEPMMARIPNNDHSDHTRAVGPGWQDPRHE